MAVWICRECTAAYAPDAPGCPHCRANDPIKEVEQLQRELEAMPKNSVHMGSSNAVTGEGMPETDDVEAEQETGSEDAPETVEVPEPPDAYAKKTEWVDYAVALGHDRGTVESFTKADIVELVGTRATSADAGHAAGSGEAGDLS